MNIAHNDKTHEEILYQDIRALYDSVSVINNLCSISLNDIQRKFLKANVDHISYMLNKEHIANSSVDKQPFNNAVINGTEKYILA